MAPTLLEEGVYTQNRDYYIRELFENSPGIDPQAL
jgi:hypothetical protein